MKRKDVEKEFGVSRYQIKKAVDAGELEVYTGPLAGKHTIYYRCAVEAWVKALPVAEEMNEDDCEN